MEFHTLLKHHSVLFHNKETNKELYAQKLDLSSVSVSDVHSHSQMYKSQCVTELSSTILRGTEIS